MQELREGGYPIEVRTEMLQSGIKGYCKMWNLEIRGQGYVNRPGKATATKRRAKKLGQHNWFKSTGQRSNSNNVRPSKGKKTTQTQIEGILFCPYTPNSALKKELNKVEEFMNGNRKTGRIRIVERAGPKMGQLLTNKNPWKKEWCNREGCAPCSTKHGI